MKRPLSNCLIDIPEDTLRAGREAMIQCANSQRAGGWSPRAGSESFRSGAIAASRVCVGGSLRECTSAMLIVLAEDSAV